MVYTIDYNQDRAGRWSAYVREDQVTLASRLTIEDCVNDAYEWCGDAAKLEVGAVREQPGHELFA